MLGRSCGWIEMRDDLMSPQVEIDPLIRTAPFGATEQPAIKSARGSKIMDGKGKMEWLERHRACLPPRSTCVSLDLARGDAAVQDR